jgi:Domain of unknown function (DUF4349)
MRTIRRATGLVALVTVILILGACAGSSASQAPAAEPGELGAVGGAVPAPSGAASAAPAAPDGGSGEGDGVGAPIDDARIIRTGTIDLEVADVARSLAAARDGIRALGGYIGASETASIDDSPIATVTYRIPVERWEDALDLLRGISGPGTRVVAERTQAVEVTGQIVDLEARIRNLRASESALQAIAAEAIRVSDVLEVQAQLTQVRGEIEQLTAQLVALEDQTAYATLTASFKVPVVAVEIAQQDWDPRAVVDQASADLIDIVQGLTTAGIWFAIVWLPILLVLGAIIGVVAFVVRRLRGSGPAGPATPLAPPPETGEAAAG